MLLEGAPLEFLPFDHKPIGLHLIYGIFGQFIKYGHGQSLLVSLFFNALFIFVAYRLLTLNLDVHEGNKKSLLVGLVFFLIVFQAPFVGLSGNSEILANLFILLSLFFLIKSTEKSTAVLVFFSGFIAILAISINYLSGIILSLPSLYLLLSISKEKILNRLIFYILGVSLSIVLMLSLLFYVEIFHQYFQDLMEFLKVYGERTVEERLRAVLYFSRWVLIFSPIIFSAFFFLNNQSEKKSHKLFVFLLLWAVSAFVAALLSGNLLVHYLSFMVAPLIILSSLMILKIKRKAILFVFFVPVFYCMTSMAAEIYDNYKKYTVFESNYPAIDKLFLKVQHKKVLSIRLGHVPFYLSDMKISQKYLFPNLAAFFEGNNEDQYWKKEIDDYDFILIPKDTCKTEQLPLTCKSLENSYKKVLESTSFEDYGPKHPGYGIKPFYLYKKT